MKLLNDHSNPHIHPTAQPLSSICPSIYLPVHLSIHNSIYLSTIYLFIDYSSAHHLFPMSSHPSTYPCTHLSVCPSVHSSTHPSVLGNSKEVTEWKIGNGLDPVDGNLRKADNIPAVRCLSEQGSFRRRELGRLCVSTGHGSDSSLWGGLAVVHLCPCLHDSLSSY
jgi:hypothetical protein